MTYFDCTLLLHFGGILFQMIHVVYASISIFVQILIIILFSVTCYILFYCTNLSTMLTLTLFICIIITSCSVVLLWHFVPLVFLMYYGCFDLHVFMPLYYICYYLDILLCCS